MLPPLHHAYIIPFVPSGFWPRLMSRVLSDKTIIQLAKDGCNIDDRGIYTLHTHCLSLSYPLSLWFRLASINMDKMASGTNTAVWESKPHDY